MTAEAAFSLVDRASNTIRKIGGEATKSDKLIGSMGDRLDSLNSAKTQRNLSQTKKNVAGIGTVTEKTAAKVDVGARKMENSYARMADRGTAQIAKLMAALKEVEKERATATLDVDIAKAEAKIRLLKSQINTFSTAHARRELDAMGISSNKLTRALGGGGVGGGGGGPPSFAGAGSAGGGAAGGLARGFLGAAGALGFFTTVLVAALPAITAVTGAVSALVGSLGAGALGAGALGVGALGAGLVGGGSILAIAKPAIEGLKEVKKAQDAYNQSVAQYGNASSQAAAKLRTLQSVQRQNRGAGALLQNAKTFSTQFRRQTRAGREDFYGTGNDSLRLLSRDMNTFGSVTNMVMASVRQATTDFVRSLTTPEFRRIIESLGTTFSRSIENLGPALGNLALVFGRIAQASGPNVVAMFDRFDKWTERIVNKTSDTAALGRNIGDMTDQLKSWINLFTTAGKLAFAFFGTGARQGQSMVDSVTKTLDKWTHWVEANPEKIQGFFDRTIDSTGQLVRALGKIAKSLGEIGDDLLPILNTVSQLADAMGPALQPLLALSALGFVGKKVGNIQAGLGMVGLPIGRGRGGIPVAGGSGLGAAETAAVAGGAGVLAARAGTARAAAGAGRGFQLAYGGIEGARYGAPVSQLGSRARFLSRGARALPGIGAALVGYNALMAYGQGGWGAAGSSVAQSFDPLNPGGLLGNGYGLAAPGPSPDQLTENARYQINNLQAQLPKYGSPRRQRQFLTRDVLRRGGGSFVGSDSRELDDEGVKQLLDAARSMRSNIDTTQASKAFQDLTTAFDTRWSKMGSGDATRGFMGGLQRSLQKLGPEGKRTLLHATADWTAVLENGTKHQQAAAERMKTAIVKAYQDMGRQIRVVNGQIYDTTKGKWPAIRQVISSEAERALQEASDRFTKLQWVAVDALVNMGYSRSDAISLTRGMEAGSGTRKQTQGVINATGDLAKNKAGNTIAPSQGALGHPNTALGGRRIGGIGRADSVNMGAWQGAPGELVINRHSERKLDRRLGMPGATAMLVGGEHTPHNQNVFAYGGLTPGMSALDSKLQSMGFAPGSTTGGKHAPNSYHYRGMATDFGDATNDLQKLWSVLYPRRREFAELFGPTYLHPGPTLMHNGVGFVDAGLQAQHQDHIHVALAGAIAGALRGGGGVTAQQLMKKLGGVRAGGAPGAMVNAGTRAVAQGMASKINLALGATAGGSYDIGGLGSNWTGKGALSFNQVARLAESVGLPGITFAQIAKGESAFIPTAVGHDPGGTRGLGLWQITTGYNDDIIKRFGGEQAMFNPRTNALAARAIYDRQGLQAWYGTRYLTDTNAHFKGARGGRAPVWGGWHAGGMDNQTFHRPTLIGVGESGQETVSVKRPGDNNTGGGHSFSFQIGKIVNNEPGDIEEILVREVEGAMRRLNGNNDEDELG